MHTTKHIAPAKKSADVQTGVGLSAHDMATARTLVKKFYAKGGARRGRTNGAVVRIVAKKK